MNLKLFQLDKDLQDKKIKNIYLFCSVDMKLIKDTVNKIKSLVLNKDFIELNYINIDGNKLESIDEIVNACETLPFMSDKKVVEIYNFKHLSKGKNDSTIIKQLKEYLKKVPSECVLIMHYPLENDREKPSQVFNSISAMKEVCGCKLDKLKGIELNRKVKEMFDKRKKKINRSDLSFFCSVVDNNMSIIENEVEKLCAFTEGREITKKDIEEIMPQKGENDIFNLVDSLSQRKVNRAIDILNELVYRGEPVTMILSMIERQFKNLLYIKLYMDQGKNKEEISSKLKLHPYVCENMMKQSTKFKEQRLKNILDLCIDAEKRIKTSTTDSKVEMEILIMNTLIA